MCGDAAYPMINYLKDYIAEGRYRDKGKAKCFGKQKFKDLVGIWVLMVL